MVDSKNDNLIVKQVEINTIASSLAGLSTQFSLMHRWGKKLNRIPPIR